MNTSTILPFIKERYKKTIVILTAFIALTILLKQGFLLFHVFVEMFSIVIAYSLYAVVWNTRKVIDNPFFIIVGISALFTACLDIFHVITYQGMNIIKSPIFYSNQFWIAARFMEALSMLLGAYLLHKHKKAHTEDVFLIYAIISILVILSILYWEIFPVCFIKDQGQTLFKIYSEYIIICIKLLVIYILYLNKKRFNEKVYYLIFLSLLFAIISEFSFTLYVSNYGFSNQIGHFAKLITLYFLYKATLETGFINPTEILFKNIKDSEEKYKQQSILLSEFNANYLSLNEQLKMHMDELNALNIQVNKKNQELDKLIQTKDKMISIIAHDLRNPFNTLIGFSNLLMKNAQTYPSVKIKLFAKNMYIVSTGTYTLLENLLNWSRLQTGDLKTFFEPIKPSEIIMEIHELISPTANSKDIRLAHNISSDEEIFADKEMLKTVLRNLVTNALKFSERGAEIIISVKNEQNNQIFCVHDNGIGIGEEKLNNLFKNIENISTPGTENETGSGLGLILCKEFVEKNNGQIWVKSTQGKGSSFCFSIPLSTAKPTL